MTRLQHTLSRYVQRHFSSRAYLTWFGLACAVMMWDHYRPADLHLLRDGYQQIFVPFRSYFDRAASWLIQQTERMDRYRDQEKIIAQLQSDNIVLRQWYQLTQSLLVQNESLVQYLASPLFDYALPLQHYLVRGQSRYLIDQPLRFDIAAGAVTPGAAVVNADGLIGRVMHVDTTVAEVQLLNHYQSRIPVMVGTHQSEAVLVGRGEQRAVLKYHALPDYWPLDPAQAKKSWLGDQVYSSGYLGLLPQGIPVGRVVAQDDDDWVVALHFNPLKVRHIGVINSAHDALSLSEPASTFETVD